MTSSVRPRVSVVIACFNLGAYLGEAVDSALAQSLKEMEVILVDDGSTEPATLVVLQDMAAKGIQVVRTPNRGPAAARNEGIRRSRGEYVLPLDADDRISANYLERAAEILDKDPEVGVVYGEVELFGESQGRWQQPDFSVQTLLFENMIVASALFRRSDWERVGGYRSSMNYGWEDWDFWLSLVEIGRKAVRLPGTIFFYRIRGGSRTDRMLFRQKTLMFWNLIWQHKNLYLKNFSAILKKCLRPGRRVIVSPR